MIPYEREQYPRGARIRSARFPSNFKFGQTVLQVENCILTRCASIRHLLAGRYRCFRGSLLNAFMFVKCFANSTAPTEYRSQAKFQLAVVARLSPPRRTPRTWIRFIRHAVRWKWISWIFPSRRASSSFLSITDSVFRVDYFIFILSNNELLDKKNIIETMLLEKVSNNGKSLQMIQSIRFNHRPAKSQEVSW